MFSTISAPSSQLPGHLGNRTFTSYKEIHSATRTRTLDPPEPEESEEPEPDELDDPELSELPDPDEPEEPELIEAEGPKVP